MNKSELKQLIKECLRENLQPLQQIEHSKILFIDDLQSLDTVKRFIERNEKVESANIILGSDAQKLNLSISDARGWYIVSNVNDHTHKALIAV